jgi:hypothetical protein
MSDSLIVPRSPGHSHAPSVPNDRDDSDEGQGQQPGYGAPPSIHSTASRYAPQPSRRSGTRAPRSPQWRAAPQSGQQRQPGGTSLPVGDGLVPPAHWPEFVLCRPNRPCHLLHEVGVSVLLRHRSHHSSSISCGTSHTVAAWHLGATTTVLGAADHPYRPPFSRRQAKGDRPVHGLRVTARAGPLHLASATARRTLARNQPAASTTPFSTRPSSFVEARSYCRAQALGDPTTCRHRPIRQAHCRVRHSAQLSRQHFSCEGTHLTSRALHMSLVVIPVTGIIDESIRYSAFCGFSCCLSLFMAFVGGKIPVCCLPCGLLLDVGTMSVQLL